MTRSIAVRCGVLDGGEPHNKLLGRVGAGTDGGLEDVGGLFAPLRWSKDGRTLGWNLYLCTRHGVVGVSEPDLRRRLNARASFVHTTVRAPKSVAAVSRADPNAVYLGRRFDP